MIFSKLLTTALVAAVAISSVTADELKSRGASSFPAPVYKAWTSDYFTTTKDAIFTSKASFWDDKIITKDIYKYGETKGIK